MEIKIKITPPIKELLAKLGADVQEGINAGMTNLVSEVEARAVKLTPVRTSNLVNSITSYITKGRGTIRATAPYASYVHEGTGLYGPHKQMIIIKAKPGKALYWPGAEHPVKSVRQKGHRPNPFFDKAVKQINPQKIFDEGIQQFLKMRGW